MINVVLFEPEIPQNTGNIMRTCVAIGARLHLIKPFGFALSQTKRAAVNYTDSLDYLVYDDFLDFKVNNKGIYLFYTRYATKDYCQFLFDETENYYLIFGKESTGIDKEILKNNLENCFRIPTTDKVRSLNLANSVAIVAYEAMRQLSFSGLIGYDIHKGIDFLN